jgi:hypothetical protein
MSLCPGVSRVCPACVLRCPAKTRKVLRVPGVPPLRGDSGHGTPREGRVR